MIIPLSSPTPFRTRKSAPAAISTTVRPSLGTTCARMLHLAFRSFEGQGGDFCRTVSALRCCSTMPSRCQEGSEPQVCNVPSIALFGRHINGFQGHCFSMGTGHLDCVHPGLRGVRGGGVPGRLLLTVEDWFADPIYNTLAVTVIHKVRPEPRNPLVVSVPKPCLLDQIMIHEQCRRPSVVH